MYNYEKFLAGLSLDKADRIGGLFAQSSNISIFVIVNSKIALVFESEWLN